MSEEQANYRTDEDKQHKVLFMMLVQQHQQIGLMGLGEIEHPADGEKKVDLKTVKYAIDTMHMLETYTKGNISSELQEYLETTLQDLRLKYVKAGKENEATE